MMLLVEPWEMRQALQLPSAALPSVRRLPLVWQQEQRRQLERLKQKKAEQAVQQTWTGKVETQVAVAGQERQQQVEQAVRRRQQVQIAEGTAQRQP